MKVGCKQIISQRLCNYTVHTAQPKVTISKEYLSNTPVVGKRLVCVVTQGHTTVRVFSVVPEIAREVRFLLLSELKYRIVVLKLHMHLK